MYSGLNCPAATDCSPRSWVNDQGVTGALADRYGDGHYGTQAAHGEHWRQFCDYARDQGVRDVRQVTEELVTVYGQVLQEQVAVKVMAVSYAQNLLSSVNVVLEAMRGDS